MRLRARTGDCRASAGGQGAADIRMGRSKKGRWGGGCTPEGGVRSEGTQSRTPREAQGLCPLWREAVAGREGQGWGGAIEEKKKRKRSVSFNCFAVESRMYIARRSTLHALPPHSDAASRLAGSECADDVWPQKELLCGAARH